MRIEVSIEGDFSQMLKREVRLAERAVQRGIDAGGTQLQADWRAQIVAAKLGNTLPKTIRKKTFPKSGNSINAASLVYSNASKVIDAFDRGALIRSKHGFYLAIPTAKAGKKGIGNKRITPLGWERRTGKRLTFVYQVKGPSLLIDKGLKEFRRPTDALSFTNPPQQRGFKRKPVVMFILVPQVKLPKRLNLDSAANAVGARLPALILANWPETDR